MTSLLQLYSVTSVNLKKAGMASRNIVMKNNGCYSDQLCSSLWTYFSLISTFVIAYRGVDFC